MGKLTVFASATGKISRFFLCLFIAKPSLSETMFTARETALVKHWFECSMRLVALNALKLFGRF